MEMDQCSLVDIRWKSLFQGARSSKCSEIERSKRIHEAQRLLEHVFHLPYRECLAALINSKELAEYLVNECPLLQSISAIPPPTKEALLTFKDQLRIPDHDWKFVVETFQMKGDVTLHYLRQLREQWNSDLKATVTPTGNGAELDLFKVLQYLFQQKPPNDPSKPVRIKFAFDGTTATKSRRRQVEIGTLEILTDRSIGEIKSPFNAVQWIIYIGAEEWSNLQEELANALPVLKKLHDEHKVTCCIVKTYSLSITDHS